MRIDSLERIFSVVNSVMLHKFYILGFNVTLYDFIFYELLICVVLGAVFFIFSKD